MLSAVDDTFRHLMARAKSKERAFRDVYDAVNQNTFAEITPELLRNAEDLHFNQYFDEFGDFSIDKDCLLYTSPSPRDRLLSRMPSSA